MPVKIYFPRDGATSPCPVVLFSHGLGGSREGYAYLGPAWAARGYVSVHVQHEGSDEAVWRDTGRPLKALREAVTDPSVAINRPLDLTFALDRLEELAKDPSFPLHGRLDFSRVGAAGHSFGAFTVMALAGWEPADGERRSPPVADPRIKAAIAMSTPLARRDQEGEGSGYTRVKISVLHLTGTLDTDRAGGASDPAFRRIPYDRTTRAPAWLVTLNGGDHMVFSGRPAPAKKPRFAGRVGEGDRSLDPQFQALIVELTRQFWDAQLRDDPAARAWLNGDGIVAAVQTLAAFERKNPR